MKGINTLVNADCSHVSRRAYFDETYSPKNRNDSSAALGSLLLTRASFVRCSAGGRA
jgi:hypothetical protein